MEWEWEEEEGGGGVQQLIVNCLLYHAMHIHSDSES